MGQQNVEYYNKFSIQKKYSDISNNLARKNFVYNHYRVGKKVEKYDWRHAYMIEETFSTENCELEEWICKKTSGALEETLKIRCNKVLW